MLAQYEQVQSGADFRSQPAAQAPSGSCTEWGGMPELLVTMDLKDPRTQVKPQLIVQGNNGLKRCPQGLHRAEACIRGHYKCQNCFPQPCLSSARTWSRDGREGCWRAVSEPPGCAPQVSCEALMSDMQSPRWVCRCLTGLGEACLGGVCLGIFPFPLR